MNYLFIVLLTLVIGCSWQSYPEKSEKLVYNKAPNIPQFIQFCGETLQNYSLTFKIYLLEEFTKVMYWHSQVIITLFRQSIYRSLIDSFIKARGLPEDIRYAAIGESSFYLSAISPKGAGGIWQIMPSLAKDYSLEVTLDVDERFCLIRSTEVALDYLQKAYGEFKSWILALAAYNTGIPALKKIMAFQRTSQFNELYLPEETSRYIARIMAFKIITENPLEYGYDISNLSFLSVASWKIYKITLKNEVNLKALSDSLNISYQVFRMFNQHFRNPTFFLKNEREFYITYPIFGIKKQGIRD